MTVSNADRVVYPESGLTKGDVFEHYLRVSPALFPFLEGRALTVERYPKGIGDQGFMQKNAPDHYPEDIDRHRVPKEGGGTTVYPVVRRPESIAFFANQGVITFHVPPVRVDDVDRPDWVIWDLDPTEGDVTMARDAAKALRDILSEYQVEVMVMTSGSKGYHLRTRLRPGLDGDTVAMMARGVAVIGAERHPDLLTVEFHKKNRGDRVFVDWLRNAPYATAVAPWSLRAREGAPLAAPISWEELDTVAPDAIRLADVEARLSSDPWTGMKATDLDLAAEMVEGDLGEAGITLTPFDRFRP